MGGIFVTRQLPGPALQRLADEHEVRVWPHRLPPDAATLRREAAGAEGLLTLLSDRVDRALIESAPRLRAIANYAVGYDNIDLEAAVAHGIAVGNTPNVLTEATADLTWALLLAAARHIRAATPHDWLTWEPAGFLGAEVHGATLGILGLGRIGRAVARRAEGFSMRVIHEPFEEVVAQADFLSLHVPLTPQTHHLIDARALRRMPAHAILINTARGPVVDQSALVDALTAATIGGAALDVTDPEPPPPDDPIRSAPNLLLTPHIGSATRTARSRMAELAVENLLVALRGQPMPHPVP
jgi:glyoxylate reductase